MDAEARDSKRVEAQADLLIEACGTVLLVYGLKLPTVVRIFDLKILDQCQGLGAESRVQFQGSSQEPSSSDWLIDIQG
jgi:hypothetical protein